MDKISFTGGTVAARAVMVGAAESLTPLALELGGTSANIVFGDADLGAAAAIGGLLGAVLLSGQGCALLAAYVHTRDLARAHRVAHALDVGTVTVNGFPSNSPTLPFGGVKQSGFGREGGPEGLAEFWRPKNILITDGHP